MALLSMLSFASIALLPAAPPRGAVLQHAAHRCRVGPLSMEVVEAPKIESACGFDFVPLLTALQAGEFREADQLTRDGLIKLAGEQAVARGYVYYTEVPKLPIEDMATIERLWQTYSDGKFGYAVQRAAFNSKKVGGNFDRLCERIGWTNDEGKLLRWLPEEKGDEFIYDVDKAPKGHLPLTSALRGTQLILRLMEHPAWELEEFANVE